MRSLIVVGLCFFSLVTNAHREAYTSAIEAINGSHLKTLRNWLETHPSIIDVGCTHCPRPSLLNYAIRHGRLESVAMLLDKGADETKTDNERGDRALHIATRKGYRDIVRLLLKEGTDVNIRNNKGNTALHTVARAGFETGIKEPQPTDFGGEAAFHPPFGAEHLEIARLLLNQEADIHAQNNRGETPLHTSARSGHLEVVMLLVQQGADVNKKDFSGLTPLDQTFYLRHRKSVPSKKIVRFLIRQGATHGDSLKPSSCLRRYCD